MSSDAAPHTRFLQSKYFSSLDGLRAISIVAVVWHHTGGEIGGIFGRGHLGVQLFFAISGLLITTLLLRERQRTGTISLRLFYIRRTLRIFPLYFAVLGLYVVVVTLLDRHTPAGTQFYFNLRYYLTYTSNWFVKLNSGERVIFYFAWSLATEEQFYLFWPSIVRFTRGWQVPVAFMTLLMIAGEVCRSGALVGQLDPESLVARVLASVATPICLGCLAAFLLHHPKGFRVAYTVAGRRWSAPFAAVFLAATVAIAETPLLIISLAMAFLVVTCTIRPDHPLRPFLENRAVRYVGTISYGMYLLHMLAVNSSRRVIGAHSSWAIFPVALVIATALAGISYRFYEQRFLRLKAWFEPSQRSSTAPGGGPGDRNRSS